MKNKQPKVIFRTFAHNAEKTVARTIESVLAQTYGNLEMHLVDNGSTDGTGRVMEEYAARDPRVRVFVNEENYVWKEGNKFTDYYRRYDIEKDFVCFIDADDEYTPDFLEKMVPFAVENNLDIACCGNDLVSEETGEAICTGKAGEASFIDGEGFCLLFPQYYSFICTRWAKLFSLSVTDRLDLGRIFWMYHREDFVEIVEHFRNAGRVGVYPGSFYKWYYSGQSLSYRWDKRRIGTDRVVFDLALRYLFDKTGRVTARNYTHLCESYFGALTSTLELLYNAETSLGERIGALHDMFTCRHTREAAAFSSVTYESAEKEKLVACIMGRLAEEELPGCGDEEKVSDILSAVNLLSQRSPEPAQAALWAVQGEGAARAVPGAAAAVPGEGMAQCGGVRSVLEISGFDARFGRMLRNAYAREAGGAGSGRDCSSGGDGGSRDCSNGGDCSSGRAQEIIIDRIDLMDSGLLEDGAPGDGMPEYNGMHEDKEQRDAAFGAGAVYNNVYGSEALSEVTQQREPPGPPPAPATPGAAKQSIPDSYGIIVIFHLFENMNPPDAKALLEALLTRANKQVLVITPEYPYDLQSEDENKHADVRAYHPAFFLGMDFSYKMMGTQEGNIQAYSFFPKGEQQ